MRTLTSSLSLVMLSCAFVVGVSACDATSGGDGGGDVDVKDDGKEGEGEGEGEGELQTGEYEGVAEAGVICGEDHSTDICSDIQLCCVALDISTFSLDATCSEDNASSCDSSTASLVCDGPEDCGLDEECCLEKNGSTYATTCVATGHCGEGADSASLVCLNTAGCPNLPVAEGEGEGEGEGEPAGEPQLCCGLDGVSADIDLGFCAPASNNCQLPN